MYNVSNKIFTILFADDSMVLIEDNNLDVIITSQVSCSKFIGIILDNKLNWTPHIAYIFC